MQAKPQKRTQHCTFCKNHGMNTPKKGHHCPHLNCKCLWCELTKKAQIAMRHQQRIWRHQKQKLKMQLDDEKIDVEPIKSGKSQACDKCRNHNILRMKRNHQCPFQNCDCDYCSLTFKRREIMKHQQRVRRSGITSHATDCDSSIHSDYSNSSESYSPIQLPEESQSPIHESQLSQKSPTFVTHERPPSHFAVPDASSSLAYQERLPNHLERLPNHFERQEGRIFERETFENMEYEEAENNVDVVYDLSMKTKPDNNETLAKKSPLYDSQEVQNSNLQPTKVRHSSIEKDNNKCWFPKTSSAPPPSFDHLMESRFCSAEKKVDLYRRISNPEDMSNRHFYVASDLRPNDNNYDTETFMEEVEERNSRRAAIRPEAALNQIDHRLATSEEKLSQEYENAERIRYLSHIQHLISPNGEISIYPANSYALANLSAMSETLKFRNEQKETYNYPEANFQNGFSHPEFPVLQHFMNSRLLSTRQKEMPIPEQAMACLYPIQPIPRLLYPSLNK